MPAYTDGGYKSFPNGPGAIDANLRVTLALVSGVLVTAVAGATNAWLGSMRARVEADAHGAVSLKNKEGTTKYVADGAVAQLATVYTADGGKVSATGGLGRYRVGQALTTATDDGDLIEVLNDSSPLPEA